MSRMAYRMKGYGPVQAIYHSEFRAYEYKVGGIVYLSLGPGWAYHRQYLQDLLVATYNFYYLPVAGDCVVDIGAGLGEETSVYAVLVGEKGVVHSLEANPVTFGGLQYLCEQNNYRWVHPHQKAIYRTNSTVHIEDDSENYLINTITENPTGTHGYQVQAITLDTLVEESNIHRIDFMKSNVEGAEQFLIEGMEKSIKIIKHVCISCHDFRHIYHQHGEFYLTKERVIMFLEDNGFEVVNRNTGNRVIDDYVYGRNRSIV
ncbi:MAG: FkbM family methyltransferase [Flammeovirgaceae bacterium]|nr:FkbM family methyltransferase [Flammeovirgaceae bacterium]